MWTNLKDPEDYQMLKLAIAARDGAMVVMKISPLAAEAAERPLVTAGDEAFVVWPTFYNHGKSAGWRTAVNEHGTFDIGQQNAEGKVIASSCTPGGLKSSLLRLIDSIEHEHKLAEDEPFWVFISASTAYICGIPNYGKIASILQEQAAANSKQRLCPYWRLTSEWLAEHPFTLKKLKDLVERLPKKTHSDASGAEADQFQLERRKVLLGTIHELYDTALKDCQALSPSFAGYGNYGQRYIGRVLREMLTAAVSGMAKKEEREYCISRICARQMLEHTPYVKWPLVEKYFKELLSSESWKTAKACAKMITEDPAVPDIRYALYYMGME